MQMPSIPATDSSLRTPKFARACAGCRPDLRGAAGPRNRDDGRQDPGQARRWRRPGCRYCRISRSAVNGGGRDAAHRASEPRRRFSGVGEGRLRRRWARHAAGPRGRLNWRSAVTAAQREAASVVRRRHGVRRAIRRAGASRRGADPRGRTRQGRRTLASGTAPCSAATRSSSRRARLRSSTTPCARRSGAAAVAAGRAVGYVGARHGRVRRGPRRPVLLPGDEHPASGRAPGNRAGHRAGSRPAAAAGRRGSAAYRPRLTRRRLAWPRDRGAPLCRRRGRLDSCLRPAVLHGFSVPESPGVRVDAGVAVRIGRQLALRLAAGQGDRARIVPGGSLPSSGPDAVVIPTYTEWQRTVSCSLLCCARATTRPATSTSTIWPATMRSSSCDLRGSPEADRIHALVAALADQAERRGQRARAGGRSVGMAQCPQRTAVDGLHGWRCGLPSRLPIHSRRPEGRHGEPGVLRATSR